MTLRAHRAGVLCAALGVAAALGVLGVGAVRSVRSELVLSRAWQAVEAARW